MLVFLVKMTTVGKLINVKHCMTVPFKYVNCVYNERIVYFESSIARTFTENEENVASLQLQYMYSISWQTCKEFS